MLKKLKPLAGSLLAKLGPQITAALARLPARPDAQLWAGLVLVVEGVREIEPTAGIILGGLVLAAHAVYTADESTPPEPKPTVVAIPFDPDDEG
jgi:hypothetical protein